MAEEWMVDRTADSFGKHGVRVGEFIRDSYGVKIAFHMYYKKGEAEVHAVVVVDDSAPIPKIGVACNLDYNVVQYCKDKDVELIVYGEYLKNSYIFNPYDVQHYITQNRNNNVMMGYPLGEYSKKKVCPLCMGVLEKGHMHRWREEDGYCMEDHRLKYLRVPYKKVGAKKWGVTEDATAVSKV